jgi:hypothetical protein
MIPDGIWLDCENDNKRKIIIWLRVVLIFLIRILKKMEKNLTSKNIKKIIDTKKH